MLWRFSRLLNSSPGDKFLFSWQNAIKYNNKYVSSLLNFIALHLSSLWRNQCVQNLVLCTSQVVLVVGCVAAVAQEIEWVV